MASCKSCGAEIIWALSSVSGKRMPLDVAVPRTSRPSGLFALLEGPFSPIAVSAGWFYAGTKPLLDTMPTLRQSHFASCPNADQHRKPRTEGAPA